MIHRLGLPDGLYLVHSDQPGEGKTRGMAKGPHLGCGHTLFAGGSSGFGLPVLKTPGRTVFSSLHAISRPAPDCLEIVYDVNRIVSWHFLGVKTPSIFSEVLEKLTDGYMKVPGCQQGLLMIRNRLFQLFRIKSRMAKDRSRGLCRVTCRTETGKLAIRVDGRDLAGTGELILLNEAAGNAFTRLRINGRIYDDHQIPAWISCPLAARFENPDAGVGFGVDFPDKEPGKFRLDAGREVGRGLNWAGFALTMGRRAFAYQVHFDTDRC